jgi:hypothetical protein
VRRRRAVDAALLATLLPLWVAGAVLHVKQVAGGQLAWVGVYVAAPADRDGFPTVRASGRARTAERRARSRSAIAC